MEIVVSLHLGHVFLLLDALVHEEFFLTFGLSLLNEGLAVLLQLPFALLDQVSALLFGDNLGGLRIGSCGFSHLFIQGSSFGLEHLGE